MRVHIKLMTDEKTVTMNISDTAAVAKAAGVDEDASELMSELDSFFTDVLDSNVDAGLVDLTPENAVTVLGAAEKKKTARKKAS
jgi:hypothetical protein